MSGLRYNQGKLRYDLVPSYAQEQYARVLTMGAEKYGDRNWEKGLLWMKGCMSSLERHVAAFKSGEDYDKESGLLHMAHVMTNAAFLVEFYKTHPELDDRPHSYLTYPKIGLDIDEVLANFVGAYVDRFDIDIPTECWNFDPEMRKRLESLKEDKDFWMSIKPLVSPRDIPFEPHCYVTSRIIPSEWTEEWLVVNGFPARRVITVGHDESKIDAIKNSGCEVFVDDRWDNFISINRAGICCFLMDAPHNQRYDVGHKRIKTLKDIFNRT